MRIVSLVPSATEMLFALGLGPDLVAVTHECDYPPDTRELPKVTRDVLPSGLDAAQIDAAQHVPRTHAELPLRWQRVKRHGQHLLPELRVGLDYALFVE